MITSENIFFIEYPLANQLIEKVRSLVKENKTLANASTELRNFLQSEEPVLIINDCTKKILECPEADPPFLQQDHIVLCQDFGGALIAISCTDIGTREDEISEETPIYSVTAEAILGAVSKGGFSYKTHEVLGEWKNDVFDRELRVSEGLLCHCPQGEMIMLSQSTVYDYASKGDIVIKIVGPQHLPLMWEFNRNTLKASRVFASTLDASIITYLMKFLSIYGNEESAKAIRHLLKHPNFYIRWDVAKCLGRLGSESLIEVLNYLRNDAHPEIRKASEKMITQLEVNT